MTNLSKIFGKTKAQIQKYLNNKLTKLRPTEKRCLSETFYGILESGNVTLSDIARGLNENIGIKKTSKRLSKNLSSRDFTEDIEDVHLEHLSNNIEKKSIIVFDDSDICKPRSKWLENLCPIRDGSTGETGIGYYLQYSCIVSQERKEVKSVMTRVYSSNAPGHLSRNDEREKHLRKIFKNFDNKGVYVMDRGFSNYGIFNLFGDKREFVIRAKTRNIEVDDNLYELKEWASKLKLEYATQVMSINKNGKRIYKDTAFCVRTVHIEGMKLECVVLKLEGHGNCMLFTNQKRNKLDEYAFGKVVIDQYGCRWSVEEKIRFEKQQFNYENIRIRSYIAIKNMMGIINLISAFISHLYWDELTEKIIKIAKVIKEEVRFEYYRIAEGIKRLFQMRSSPVFHFGTDSRKYFPRNYQIEFWEL